MGYVARMFRACSKLNESVAVDISTFLIENISHRRIKNYIITLKKTCATFVASMVDGRNYGQIM